MAQTAATTRKLGVQAEVIACCWHESGHVLFGLLKHLQIRSVFVNYTEVVEGITHYFRVDRSDFELDVIEHIGLDEVGMSYAGLVSESIYYKDICGVSKLPWILKEGSSLDIKAASDTIKSWGLAQPGKPRVQLKRRIQRDVNALLTEYRDDLKLISHRLYQSKRLSFDDLKALLTKRSGNKDFWKQQFREIELLFDNDRPIDNAEIRRILDKD